MSGKKIALLAGGLVVLFAVAASWLLVQNLDGLVRHAIESSASAATGTPVRVGSVAISLGEGRGTITGLTIANPPGFSGQPLLILDSIDIRLDPAALTAAVPLIEEIRIGSVTFNYEINGAGESNLRFVQKQVKRQQKATAATKAAGGAAAPTEKRFRIRRLIFADSTASLDLNQFGSGRGVARVPGMTLANLGGEQGATAQELAGEIVEGLGKNLSATVGGGALKQFGDSFSEAFRKNRER